MRRSCSSLLPSCVSSRSSLFILSSSTLILAILLLCLVAIASPLLAQQTPALVTKAVDDSVRTVLPGNVHPLARAQFDQGEAPPDLALHRMLLVLKRSPQQETVLRGLIDDQQDKHSASYHQWLAPEEFGARFGPADTDLAAVTNWLQANGFQVTQVNKGRTIVEFSGTASLVKQYFGTAIHQYAVKGGKYWANNSNPSIPTALTPVVQGFASLNNFPRRAYHTVSGPLTDNYHGGDGPLPLFTFGFNGTEFYGVGPSDFATIYNVLPLWNATPPIDGTGQTIAIVGETNINIQDIRDFRSMFGLPANDPQIMVEGPDPGILQDGEETEAIADVSWSGAVAKNATIDFVVSESTETTAGIDLSAIYIIDQNLAPVMSESYGFCEAGLGGYNAFYYFLWEQAAAQGITVMISAGDGGSAGCDNFDTESVSQFGLAVSGYASTPFNVAVGGTDFDQTPSNASTYWSSTNNATTGESAKSYVREMTWNDSCAAFGLTGCTPANSDFFDIVAGSGGQSSCAFQDSTGTICTGGYDKPSWQTGTGVPNDGVRDLPDVSLFAGDGNNGSFYILCQSDEVSPCSLNPVSFISVGGTSLASPAFTGIMSLVNQKTGSRQGIANYALYKLAAPSANSCNAATVALTGNACLFYDITVGNNSVPCTPSSYDTGECSPAPTNGFGILVNPSSTSSPAWPTTLGYDLATGLGSVNAANLVNNWSTANFTASTTTLTTLSPATIVHGASVNVTVTVAPKSGGGTPTGDVSLIGNPGGKSAGIDFGTLNSSGVATFVTNLLPGGSYNVTAHYEGDGTFGGSDSTPGMPVTVTAENSSVYMGNPPGLVVGQNQTTGAPTYGNSVVYGTGAFDLYLLRADVYNSAGSACTTPAFGEIACPTGHISFTDNGSALDGGTFNLNSYGFTEDQGIQLTGGAHTLIATYNGDNSYKGSSTTASVTVTKAASLIGNVLPSLTSLTTGQQFTVTASVTTSLSTNTSYGLAPTGTVSFFYGTNQLLGTVVLTPTVGNLTTGLPASLAASLTTSIPTAGTYNITATYSGDTNYSAVTTGQSNSVPVVVTATANFSLAAAPSSLTITPTLAGGTSTITVTSTGGFSGTVALAVTSTLPTGVTASFNPTSTTTTSVLTLTAGASATASGPTTVTITGTSGSLTQTTTISLTVTAPPNFTLSAAPSTLSIAQGTNGTSTITVAPTNGFTGTVALTVTSTLPTGVTASFNPTSTTTTSILTLTASGSAAVGGPTTVTVTGKSGSLTQTTTISLTVTPPPDFTLSANPTTLSVAQGASGTSTITVTPANGFTGSVTLAASGLPSGVTAGFGTNPATGTSILTLTASLAATAGGPVTVTITGTSGSLTHTTTVSLTVTKSYSLSAGPASPATIAPGGTATATVHVNPGNGYTGNVTLSCSVSNGSGTSGTMCSFNPNPVSVTNGSGGTSTLTFMSVAGTPAVVRGSLSGSRDVVASARSNPGPTPSGMKVPFALWLPVSGLALAGFVLASSARQRKKVRVLCLLCLVITALILLPSCGGGSRAPSCSAVPAAPTGLVASGTSSSGTTLTWTAPTTIPVNCSLTGYTIYQNGSAIGTTMNTTFNVTGLTGGTQYSFTVASNDSFGVSTQTSAASVTTATASGTYTITITGKDANNLAQIGAPATVTVTVN